jgi:hypothetical protein
MCQPKKQLLLFQCVINFMHYLGQLRKALLHRIKAAHVILIGASARHNNAKLQFAKSQKCTQMKQGNGAQRLIKIHL